MWCLQKRRAELGVAAVTSALVVLSACGSLDSKGDIDYGTAKAPTALDVPPDLTQLPRDDRYQVPQSVSASATAAAATKPQQPVAAGVAPSGANVRIMRAGTQRWLAIDLPPDQVFPRLKEFWRTQGLDLERDDPVVGIAETVWSENRAKLPLDFIRRTVGKALDNLYSTSELDKYRSRVERTPDNKSEVYISHRGMVEVFTSQQQDHTRWQPRASDPQLEVEMLQRLLLVFLEPAPTTDAATVVAAATAPQAPQVARVVKGTDGAATLVQINEPFDRAWRRVGLALDRGGFTVEDRDRTKGLYFVRYIDPDYEAKKREEQGILTRWFGRESKIDAQQFRVQVEGRGDGSAVTVLDKEGKPETSATGSKILAQISEQLR